jgi:hypothetical protein
VSDKISVRDYLVIFLIFIASISVYKLLVAVVLDDRVITRILLLIGS